MMIQTDTRKERINNIKNIIKNSSNCVEATNRMITSNIVITKSEARRLWFQLKDRV